MAEQRCTAVLGSGEPCSRPALDGSELCAYHRTVEARRGARALYLGKLSDEDREALAIAAGLEGVDAEVAMMRVLIRRVVGKQDIEAARRGIDTLCRILKTRHDLDQRTTDRLTTSLERVLDTLGGELEAPQ